MVHSRRRTALFEHHGGQDDEELFTTSPVQVILCPQPFVANTREASELTASGVRFT